MLLILDRKGKSYNGKEFFWETELGHLEDEVKAELKPK